MKLDANAGSLRTVSAARAAAGAVFEARVVVSMQLDSTPATKSLDDKLHALEMAYYRRADELAKKKPKKKRARGKR